MGYLKPFAGQRQSSGGVVPLLVEGKECSAPALSILVRGNRQLMSATKKDEGLPGTVQPHQ
jgi:hypothetical protein